MAHPRDDGKSASLKTKSTSCYQFGFVSDNNILLEQIWGTIGPMLTWIPWGVALGLAVLSRTIIDGADTVVTAAENRYQNNV
ncbi:hypothetical protein GCM10026983_27780 [Gracilibacillus alcaliphilus]